MRFKQAISLSLLFMLPLAVQAQEDLGTIDVTAMRTPTPSIASSRPVTVIDRKAIEASRVENVVDLLKGQANINISDTTGVGAKSRVDLGGFGEAAPANLVVLIDGRRVNSPDLSGVDWSQIPVDQIERIEIMHGGGSVLYGDGAVGGVINIITRIPASGGELGLNGGSFGTASGTARIGADAGTTRVEGNVSGLTTDGYRDNNSFERFDGGGRAEVDLPADISLVLSGNHHRDRAGLPGALTAAQVAANREQAKNPRDFSRTSDTYVDGGLSWVSDARLELDVAGGMRRRDVHSEFISFSSTSDFVQRTRSLRPRLNYTFGDTLRVRTTIGGDFDRSDGNFTFSSGVAPTAFDRSRDGFYGLLELGNERWHVNAGGRSERIKDTFRQSAVSATSNRLGAWQAGVSLDVIQGLRLRLDASRSLRFPLLDERFSFFTGAINPGLLPQAGRHYGIGLRYGLAAGWAEAAFSRADVDNEIFFNPLTFSNANYTDKTRHDVLLINGQWQAHDWLQLAASYTYTRASFRGGAFAGNTIPAVAKHRAGASWHADWGLGFTTLLRLNYVGASFLISDQANARRKLPAYVVVDAVASYRWQDIEVFARIDNLLNRKYSTYAVFSSFAGTDNFYPAPEIAFHGGASYYF